MKNLELRKYCIRKLDGLNNKAELIEERVRAWRSIEVIQPEEQEKKLKKKNLNIILGIYGIISVFVIGVPEDKNKETETDEKFEEIMAKILPKFGEKHYL